MNDFSSEVTYKGKKYKLVFNLNVMETIQKKYGTLDKWGELTDGTEYAKRQYESETGSREGWDDLKAKDKAKYNGEPDAQAVIYGFTQMINEGIDIDNEENGTDNPPMTLKQVGRLITEIGLANATATLNNTVVESTKSDEKNV